MELRTPILLPSILSLLLRSHLVSDENIQPYSLVSDENILPYHLVSDENIQPYSLVSDENAYTQRYSIVSDDNILPYSLVSDENAYTLRYSNYIVSDDFCYPLNASDAARFNFIIAQKFNFIYAQNADFCYPLNDSDAVKFNFIIFQKFYFIFFQITHYVTLTIAMTDNFNQGVHSVIPSWNGDPAKWREFKQEVKLWKLSENLEVNQSLASKLVFEANRYSALGRDQYERRRHTPACRR